MICFLDRILSIANDSIGYPSYFSSSIRDTNSFWHVCFFNDWKR